MAETFRQRRKHGTGLPDPAPLKVSQFRIAIVVASSACLGGIALAVWNRSVLRRMRTPTAEKPEQREFT